VLEQWKGELEERFGLVFEILDRAYLLSGPALGWNRSGCHSATAPRRQNPR